MLGSSSLSRRVVSIPSIVGIRTSISTTSGLVVSEELQGLGPVARLAYDHELVGVQERDQRVTEPRVVVYHQHADTLARGRRSPLHQHVTSVT